MPDIPKCLLSQPYGQFLMPQSKHHYDAYPQSGGTHKGRVG